MGARGARKGSAREGRGAVYIGGLRMAFLLRWASE